MRAAADIGFDSIEWILNSESRIENPFWSHQGRQNVLEASQRSSVEISSICVDLIMEDEFWGNESDPGQFLAQQVKQILEGAKELECRRLVFPLLDRASLSKKENLPLFSSIFSQLAESFSDANITCLIEVDIPAEELLNFLKEIPHVKICYDLGNVITFGYDSVAEIKVLSEQIEEIHIKDRTVKDGSVLLGEGETVFSKSFDQLFSFDYQGPFVIEAPRGESPIETGKKHFAFVTNLIKERIQP